jgi:SlyX protein
MDNELAALRAQLIELQTQVAYQEDTLTALNEAVAGQQQDILVMRRQLQLLKEQLQAQDLAADSSAPPLEKPPHY